MAGVWVPPGKQTFVNPADNTPLVGGQVFHYIPGTDTPKNTYQDQAEIQLNANPITLDMNGECTIWGEGLFRQVLFDSLGNQIWDQVTGFLGGGGGDVTFATPSQVAAGTSTDTVISPYALNASGVLSGGHYGSSKPLADYGVLSLDGVTVGNNDTILAAAEADSTFLHFYGPAGTIRTNRTVSQLTKGYQGDGFFITGPGSGDGAFRPPRFSNMTVKPSTWPTQGDGGWFRGDQRFTDNGEWKIIGTGVRTYDITSRYFESNTIPHSKWFDINSGNSGENAYLTSGATAGSSTITLSYPASSNWVGQLMAFSAFADGTVTESHTVTGISGNTFSIAPAVLSNSYVWNPPSQTPVVFTAHRTMAVFDYIKLRFAGGGDSYGSIIRQNVNYQPLASEYHTFMAATGGQYGGDVYFNANGVYGQFFESQLQGQTYDVTAVGFVGSYVRNVDYALDGGKFWCGTQFQSTGSRPADVAHNILGNWRNGVDTTFATLYETSRLTVAASSGNISITVASTNGAHPNDPCVIGPETLTINNVNSVTKVITFTTSLVGSYAVDQLVTYPKGGAALNMAKGHRFVWYSSLSSSNRSGDPLGVFPVFYGNVQGDLLMEGGTDTTSDFWSIRFARGTTAAAPDTSRIRLRPTSMQFFSTAGTGVTGFAFNGGDVGIANNLNINQNALFSLGVGVWITYDGSHIKGTLNGGASYTTIV